MAVKYMIRFVIYDPKNLEYDRVYLGNQFSKN